METWQIAWEAILTRGIGSQDVRWVKGHATEEDISQGRSNSHDKEGNDRSDTNADKGVEIVAGEGLVTLAKWAAQRYEGYLKFMARVHKMIAAVTMAEKEERGKEKKKEKAILGYDPEKWTDANCVIKNGSSEGRMYQALDLPPPIRGRHKHCYCQRQYLDVHAFMKRRRWTHVDMEEDVAGITWVELFVLFDTEGHRSPIGEHVRDQKARERVEARKSVRDRTKHEVKRAKLSDAVTKPLFDEEVKRFKAICRQVARHELEEKQAQMFLMEGRGKIKRLANLGVYGHQPGIAAHVHTTAE